MDEEGGLTLEPRRSGSHDVGRVSRGSVFEDDDEVGGGVEARIDLHAGVGHDGTPARGER